MPTVRFRGKEIECREGATLRDVLLNEGLTPHNGKSEKLNCRGFASCGTCAVRVEGEVGDVGVREKVRLLVPPHHPNYKLRLACQTKVLGDVRVEKFPGMWGTQLAEEPLGPVDNGSSPVTTTVAEDERGVESDSAESSTVEESSDDTESSDDDPKSGTHAE